MSIKFLWTWTKFVYLSNIKIISFEFFSYLDASAPTLINNKTNLHKGDLFVISLNDDDTQKLVMQVDEERAGPSVNPGN